MSSIDYATIIFGGMYKIRQLLVKELQEEREKAYMSAKELDASIGFGPGWSRVSEMEEHPQLLKYSFLEKMPAAYKGIMGVEIQETIEDYLERHPHDYMIAMRDFLKSPTEVRYEIRVRILERNRYLKKPLPIHINSTPANVYVRMYVFVCILERMKKIDVSHSKFNR